MRRIVVAAVRPWNLRNARKLRARLKGTTDVVIVDSPAKLTAARLAKLTPAYVFFPHWSWIIPKEIYSKYECVVFHMTDLPFGRGGSPLQNLIVRGLRRTRVSAIRVSQGLDTGPIYMKSPAQLSGSAQEIYERISAIVFEKMIPEMLKHKLTPRPQRGKIVPFVRRKPSESRMPEFQNISQAYDFIRMLDAEGYPRAFLETGSLIAEFRKARLERGSIKAEVVFRRKEKA